MTQNVLGVIGGSGFYEMESLENTNWQSVDTPWGKPSDDILSGNIGKQKFFFLPRHGRGHIYSPSDINYRANIDALKRVGVTHILSLSACGSFREDLNPGKFVIVDQFFDRTISRKKTFFGDGLVAHISFNNPVCSSLADIVVESAQELKLDYFAGGTYLAIEGPQFSTLAESIFYKNNNFDVIGMTNMPEAKLAREAEIHYSTVAMVTDYDCWHESHGTVDVQSIIKVLKQNTENAKNLVEIIAQKISRLKNCNQRCNKALDNAIITHKENWAAKAVSKLDLILARYLKENE